MKNVRYALALFAVIALCLTTSAAFADTTLNLNSAKTLSVVGADQYGNAVTPSGTYTFALTEGSDVCRVEYASSTSANVIAGSKSGACTVAIVDPSGTQIGTEHVTVPPGPVVSYSFNWQ